MARHPNWPKRLARMANAARRMPHAYGPHDCASFALVRCFYAVTGRHLPIVYFHKSYAGEAEADAVMAQMNCADVEELAEAFLPRKDVAQAQRGDIGVVLHGGRKTLVVCYGGRCIGPGAAGAHTVSRSELIAAFEVA